MKPIPETTDSPVLRTDFSNQSAWEAITKTIQVPVGPFRAYVECIDDQAYCDITKAQLLDLIPNDFPHSFIMVVDHTTVTQADFPVLIIDLYERSGNEFRAVASCIQEIENNLSIANLDFETFAEAVDESGVYRSL